MPLWDFRAHATWQTCLSSYVFTFLADAWKSHSAGGCIHRCRRLSRGCKPTREDSPRFWQRREVVLRLVIESSLMTTEEIAEKVWGAPDCGPLLRRTEPLCQGLAVSSF